MAGSDPTPWQSACEEGHGDWLNSPAKVLIEDWQMMCYQVQIALHEGWAECRLWNEVKK